MQVIASSYELEVVASPQPILVHRPCSAGFYGAALYYRTFELGRELGLYGEFQGYVPTRLPFTQPGTYEMGARLTVSATGAVSRMAHFKTAGDTLPHVGRIWDDQGRQIATATFSGEGESGWQTQELDEGPVTLAAGSTYVVSVNLSQATVGIWGDDSSYFARPLTRGIFSFEANAARYVTAPGQFPTIASPKRVPVDIDFTYLQVPQVEVSLSWTDAGGAQSLALVPPAPKPAGSYVVAPVRFAASAVGPIVLQATSSVPHALFVSALLEKLT